MRNFITFISLIIANFSAYSFDIETESFYGQKSEKIDLSILSSTDVEVFDPVMKEFSSQNKNLRIKYVVASSVDIYNKILSGSDEFDVVMSSAMDLQMKLANDGYALTYNSDVSSRIPKWGIWQNRLFGFSLEPIVIVISQEKFENLSMPKDRRDFLSVLRSNPDYFKDKIVTYDINVSGAGYLFSTQDERQADIFWRLSEVMGGLGTKVVCCSSEMLDLIEDGNKYVAYNVIGSYAAKRALQSTNLKIIYPNDYTHILLRTAFIPKTVKNEKNAGVFLDFVLNKNGQKIMEEKSEILSIYNENINQMPNAKPIPLDTGLLIYLDKLKRQNFLREWNSAILR